MTKATTNAARSVGRSVSKAPQRKVLEGDDLIRDMEQFGERVASSPASARKFLISLGVLTPQGKRKNLIRG